MNNRLEPKKSLKEDVEGLVAGNPCEFCRKRGFPPPCRCGGGGGSDPTSEERKSDKTSTQLLNNPNIRDFINQIKTEISQEWMALLKQRAGITEFESGIFNVKSDNLHGVLTIKPKPGVKVAPEELEKNFKQIQRQFDTFKSLFADKGTNMTCVYNDKQNELVISIPHPNYYELFILRLVGEGLLRSPNADSYEPEIQKLKEKYKGVDDEPAMLKSKL